MKPPPLLSAKTVIETKRRRLADAYSVHLSLLAVLIALSPVAYGVDAPLTVTDWVILVSDPNVPQANAVTMVRSTLPEFVNGRRVTERGEKRNDPMPIGVIRVSGGGADERIDVLLENKGGKFQGHWPHAQQRSTGLLWPNLEPKSTQPALEPITPGHWFAQLRDPLGPYWVHDGKGERFVLYDAEVAYRLPLNIETAGDGYALRNTGPAPLHDLALYRMKGNQWQHARAVGPLSMTKMVATTGPTTKPSTRRSELAVAEKDSPTTQSATVPAGANNLVTATVQPAGPGGTQTFVAHGVSGQVVNVAGARIVLGGAATQSAMPPVDARQASPTTNPTTAPVRTPDLSLATIITFSGKTVPNSHAAVESWSDRLAAVGLPPTDIPLILSILEKHALDPHRLTAIYRLDPAELERLLPLEVTPQPKSMIRVGLVIALNVDPALAGEVDQLISQLGNDDWNQREAASKKLAELGAAAEPKLRDALKDKDLEIVCRAERLIAALKSPQSINSSGE